MTVPAIDTARLRLRAMTVDEVDQIVVGLNNLNVSRWLTVIPYPYTAQDAAWFINENAQGRATAWSIWTGGTMIGNIGLNGTLGNWLAEPAWGNGYATEAAVAVRDYHFENTDSSDLRSEYFVGNDASKVVLTKIGMHPVGKRISPVKALGIEVPSIEMAMTRQHWETLRPAAQ